MVMICLAARHAPLPPRRTQAVLFCRPNCAHLGFTADGVLLSGVPAPPLLKMNSASTVFSKASTKT